MEENKKHVLFVVTMFMAFYFGASLTRLFVSSEWAVIFGLITMNIFYTFSTNPVGRALKMSLVSSVFLIVAEALWQAQLAKGIKTAVVLGALTLAVALFRPVGNWAQR